MTKETVKKHLIGQHVVGLYPILPDNTSYFIAADFDGENWLSLIIEIHKYHFWISSLNSVNGITKNGKGFRITIAQTNQEVLEEIRDFVGAGYVIAVAKRRVHWKDSWVYYISTQRDILRFLIGMLRFLIVKKKLAIKVIPTLEAVVKKQKEKQTRSIYLAQNSKKLRDGGLTYREIGKILRIDFGHARRLSMK